MLYFVSTPIGNLKDITLRALEILKTVDIIACEDTRHSLRLLNAYEIKKPLISYHKFNERESGEKIISLLKEGKEIAVISDAGTPIVSDPGNVLCKMLIEEGISYTVIPGANALLPALILSGLDASRFTFVGFLPEKKKDRECVLQKVAACECTMIFYCAPHDLKKTVAVLFESLGKRKAVAVREITKIYEERIEFDLGDEISLPDKGEYVICIEGKAVTNDLVNLSPKEHIKAYTDGGMSKNEAIKQAAKDRGVSKSEMYKYTLND